MQDKVYEIKSTALGEIGEAKNLTELENIRIKYLGKKGELTSILKMMGTLSPEERPKMGTIVNEAKNEITSKLENTIFKYLFISLLKIK